MQATTTNESGHQHAKCNAGAHFPSWCVRQVWGHSSHETARRHTNTLQMVCSVTLGCSDASKLQRARVIGCSERKVVRPNSRIRHSAELLEASRRLSETPGAQRGCFTRALIGRASIWTTKFTVLRCENENRSSFLRCVHCLDSFGAHDCECEARKVTVQSQCRCEVKGSKERCPPQDVLFSILMNKPLMWLTASVQDLQLGGRPRSSRLLPRRRCVSRVHALSCTSAAAVTTKQAVGLLFVPGGRQTGASGLA